MLSALQSGSTTASQSSSHRVWGGGASRWCRACCTSRCCNLDPARGGPLIPDYGSLGLRHADAQVCTHLQSPNLSIWLSALNLKPRQRSLFMSELWQQCRRLEWDVLLKLARAIQRPAVWLRRLMYILRSSVLFARWRQWVSGNESLSLLLLSAWAQVTGTSGRDVNKPKQTLHLYGMANHHADTDYMSYRIKAGTTPTAAQANTKLYENVLPIFLPLIRNSISTCCLSLKWFSTLEVLLNERNKAEFRNFSQNSLSQQILIHRVLKPGLCEFITRPNYFCTLRQIRRTRRGETRNIVAGGRNNCSNIVHYNNSYITLWHLNQNLLVDASTHN